MDATTWAGRLLHEALQTEAKDPMALLEELAELREQQTEVDTLQVMRRARSELEERSVP